jgi:hypothetical protein
VEHVFLFCASEGRLQLRNRLVVPVVAVTLVGPPKPCIPARFIK